MIVSFREQDMVNFARFPAGLAATPRTELQNLERASQSALQSFPSAPNPAFLLYLCTARHSFFHFFLKDRYVPLDYGRLRSLFILMYEMMGVLAGNMTAIVMPKKKEPDGRHPSSKRQKVCAGK